MECGEGGVEDKSANGDKGNNGKEDGEPRILERPLVEDENEEGEEHDERL